MDKQVTITRIDFDDLAMTDIDLMSKELTDPTLTCKHQDDHDNKNTISLSPKNQMEKHIQY